MFDEDSLVFPDQMKRSRSRSELSTRITTLLIPLSPCTSVGMSVSALVRVLRFLGVLDDGKFSFRHNFIL